MPTNATEDVIERAEAILPALIEDAWWTEVALIVELLVVALRTAREDTRRLDWLLARGHVKPIVYHDGEWFDATKRSDVDAAIASEEDSNAE